MSHTGPLTHADGLTHTDDAGRRPSPHDAGTTNDRSARDQDSTLVSRSGPPLRAWLRRHRPWILAAAVFVAALIFLVTGRLAAPADAAPLSPRNPAPAGGMAAAEVLAAQGVRVDPSDSFAHAVSLVDGGGPATMLLYDPNGFLDAEQLSILAERAERLVVIAPRRDTLDGLGSGIRQAGVVPEGTTTLEPACGERAPVAAGRVTATESYIYVAGGAGRLCYSLPGTTTGTYATSADGRIVVLGSTGIMSNALLDHEGNAALVLGTLGSTPRLVWYLPGIGDVRNDDAAPTLNDLAPAWLAFAGPWLAVVVLLAILWRGRRVGPLVFEPLPVIVKAAETAEGRARLYQDARAVDRAADSLRAGCLVRLARHARLGPEADAVSVVEAIERHAGRHLGLRKILLEERPRTEAGLVYWAQQIDKLEKEATSR